MAEEGGEGEGLEDAVFASGDDGVAEPLCLGWVTGRSTNFGGEEAEDEERLGGGSLLRGRGRGGEGGHGGKDEATDEVGLRVGTMNFNEL